MGFYDLNIEAATSLLLPPQKRKPTNLAFLGVPGSKLQYLHDLYFDNYLNGSNAPDWQIGNYYAAGSRVRYRDSAIYEAVNNVFDGTGFTDDAGPYNISATEINLTTANYIPSFPPEFGFAMSLPGVEAADATMGWRVDTTLLNNTGSFTIRCRINSASLVPSNGILQVIFSKGGIGIGANGDFRLALYPDGSLHASSLSIGGNEYDTTVSAAGTISINTFYSVQLNYNASTFDYTLFVNGTLLSRTSFAGARDFNTSNVLFFGRSQYNGASIFGSSPFNGTIDEIAVDNDVVNSMDYTLPDQPFTPTASTLLLYHIDPAGLPPDQDLVNWIKVLNNWIGLRERAKYNSQKIVLEYALNKVFLPLIYPLTTTFRQPTGWDGSGNPIPNSDIFIQNNTVNSSAFFIGSDESQSSAVADSDDDQQSFIGDGYTNTPFLATINVPIAVFDALAGNDIDRTNVIRSFASKYILAGITYNVTTY